ncbi:hypothetical protein [Roseateles amylovorans]|uniref:Uncharacterized protein n=1 Tax=Roseateles amylovorans TaxID=2978473 RepID=A0ABY6B5Q5_9BURK|nr:hypothetical protein [Roseateles amylovorans]UXH79280.1 hypothetical protein N4261_04915 [Roseateles amylovorans]
MIGSGTGRIDAIARWDGLKLSDILGAPLQTSAFAEDPLRQHRATVSQQFMAGPPPSVVLQLSPFLTNGSPLDQFVGEAQADVVYGRRPLGQMAPPVDQVQTPSASRGRYTATDGPDMTVWVELGPVLWNHVERGSDAARLLDISA